MSIQAVSLFGKNLVDRGVITQDQLDEAIHRQQTSMTGKRLGDVLIRLGFISKSHVVQCLSSQLNIPIITISEREIPERIRNMIDVRIAQLYRVIPIEENGDTLRIATADPTNINSLDNLSRLLERPVEPVLGTQEEISNALNKYYGLADQTVETMLSTVSSASTMSTLSSMSNLSSLDSSAGSLGSLSSTDMTMSSMSMDSIDVDDAVTRQGDDDDDDDSPVVRYVHHLIMEAFRLRASDIHVEPAKYDIKIRYRIDGVLQLMPLPPKRAQAAIISRLKIMAGLDIAERRVPQDGRIKIQMAGRMIDLRVSSLPSFWGESIVMRILDKESLNLGLGQLGFSPEDQLRWEELLGNTNGVILVTGPTGSGKTTTLYASLFNLNTSHVKIITVEDPVEYQLSGINQVQIHHDIGWDFSRALRSIVRQDPDIIMVGEIRDSETAEIAIKAALTGHLVFSTLHTNDAPSSFVRLIDIGIKPFLVSSGVRAVLAQRLVRTNCTTCKAPYKPDEIELSRLGFPVDFENLDLLRGEGCDNCSQTGYSGRLGVYELLNTTDELRTMIMSGESAIGMRRMARKQGMTTLREDAWKKVLSGITTVEEVNRRTKIDEPMESVLQHV